MPSKLTGRAKRLRFESTDAERLLWNRIRAHRLNGWKFKRQQPLGRYIVDFVCFEAGLVVELDGGQHADAKSADAKRDAWLEAQGFRVFRFWNNEVLGNIDGVVQRIAEYFPPSPQPSPIEGEGEAKQTSPIMGEGEAKQTSPIMGEGEAKQTSPIMGEGKTNETLSPRGRG